MKGEIVTIKVRAEFREGAFFRISCVVNRTMVNTLNPVSSCIDIIIGFVYYFQNESTKAIVDSGNHLTKNLN